MRPLKAKLRLLHLLGTFWNFLAIFAFLAELNNSKHFEPYLIFKIFLVFLALQPWKGHKAKIFGLLWYILENPIKWPSQKKMVPPYCILVSYQPVADCYNNMTNGRNNPRMWSRIGHCISLLVILIAIVNLSVMIFYWGLAQIRPGSLANEFTK